MTYRIILTSCLLSIVLSTPALAQDGAAHDNSPTDEVVPEPGDDSTASSPTADVHRKLTLRERLLGVTEPKPDPTPIDLTPGPVPEMSKDERKRVKDAIWECRYAHVREEARHSGQRDTRGIYGYGSWKPTPSDFNGGKSKGRRMSEECKALIAKYDRAVNPHRYDE